MTHFIIIIIIIIISFMQGIYTHIPETNYEKKLLMMDRGTV